MIRRQKGDNAIVLKKVRTGAALSGALLTAVFIAACGGSGPVSNGSNETAATVNGKAIKMEDVDRAVKIQAQGQESRFSPLELASARLQVLDGLIQQEVMFQRAEKEGTVPTEEEITAEINKQKTQSGKSADQIEKEMKDQGVTDAILRDQIKKGLATQKLVEKITGKIEAPKDSEIQAFYDGNKEAFVKRKGVKLAAIIVDPGNSGEGDTTIDEVSAVAKANEIVAKLKAGQQFADLAREFSEDQSKFQGGDLGYISEDDLKQEFSDATAAYLMNPQFQVGGIVTARAQGKLFILKLQDRSDKDEALTLESPGVREQVQKSLVDTRKQLLTAAYQTIALNEAKIDNYLAKKVVENPNELSGARPASTANTAPAANSTPAGNTNSNTAGESPKANANAPAKDAKPAQKAPAAPAAKK